MDKEVQKKSVGDRGTDKRKFSEIEGFVKAKSNTTINEIVRGTGVDRRTVRGYVDVLEHEGKAIQTRDSSNKVLWTAPRRDEKDSQMVVSCYVCEQKALAEKKETTLQLKKKNGFGSLIASKAGHEERIGDLCAKCYDALTAQEVETSIYPVQCPDCKRLYLKVRQSIELSHDEREWQLCTECKAKIKEE